MVMSRRGFPLFMDVVNVDKRSSIAAPEGMHTEKALPDYVPPRKAPRLRMIAQ